MKEKDKKWRRKVKGINVKGEELEKGVGDERLKEREGR